MRRRIAAWTLCLVLLRIGDDPILAQAPTPPTPPRGLFDPRLETLRAAAAKWSGSIVSRRTVLDQVCLVPDATTFFEALAAWDESTWFPILIEDVPNTLRFLRAFKPARVVRLPRAKPRIEGRDAFDVALTAAARAAISENRDGKPREEAPEPAAAPGIVVVSPSSPGLPAAAALAAGRGQRLARFDFPGRFDDTLETQGMAEFVAGIESIVSARTKKYAELGDECDFVTLVGDWPYRYNSKEGTRCLDDVVGRTAGSLKRWAYTGRLLGDEKTTVYQAMCSMFLATESCALFNSYSETGAPWSEYQMRGAAARLAPLFPVAHVSGDAKATLDGWHNLFDPRNRHGLTLINSKGGPTQFDVVGRGATTLDVPQTAPTAVAMIHSFSAASPLDPATIAGRWLANGAFVYHGSVHEPYLVAFRSPELVAGLIAEGLPLGAVLRQLDKEPLGLPWKLIYVGDPLHRPTPAGRAPKRSLEFGATADWPSFRRSEPPAANADMDRRFAWLLQAALYRTTKDNAGKTASELVEFATTIDRDLLDGASRALFDDLLAEILFTAGRYRELRLTTHRIAKAERSGHVSRLTESGTVIELRRYVPTSFEQAVRVWDETMRLDLGQPIRDYATSYLTSVATTPVRRSVYRAALAAVAPIVERTESESLVRKTIEEIDKRGRPGR